jgi:hypothetical protein
MSDAGSLSFVDLDGLAFAAERGRLEVANLDYDCRELGPLVELIQLSNSGVLPGLGTASWLRLGRFDQVVAALRRQATSWYSPNGQVGLIRAGRACSDALATEFVIKAKAAAKKVGASDRLAAELTAALHEMFTNIFEHSHAMDTGFAVFDGTDASFDFAVADSGVGLLRSLRSNVRFRALASHDEALRLALAPGVSRFEEPGRGFGFNRLFVGLANRNCALRFRTGDHVLSINGLSPSLDKANAAQKVELQGFLMNVSCSLAL